MRFIFDCEDEVCLPKAYALVDEIKPYLELIKKIDSNEKTEGLSRTDIFKKIIENAMVKYPKETGEVFAKLWILEEGERPILDKNGEKIKNKKGEVLTEKYVEKAPNTFKTMVTIFTNEVAVDFFTAVLPSLLKLSKSVLPQLKSVK